MADIKTDIEKRVNFVRDLLASTGAKGVVFGNSGGKDCALTGILCRMATKNVLGINMPCASSVNYTTDMEDAKRVAEQFGIENITIDLTAVREQWLKSLPLPISVEALSNVAPRLRMLTLYAYAQDMGYLVAGTGNASERYMGYFTKWGDGAYDFNIISDLCVREIYAYLRFLDAPQSVINKAPSAGLYEGQTDEKDMGVTYTEIDDLILYGKKGPKYDIIEKRHKATQHKRVQPRVYLE